MPETVAKTAPEKELEKVTAQLEKATRLREAFRTESYQALKDYVQLFNDHASTYAKRRYEELAEKVGKLHSER